MKVLQILPELNSGGVERGTLEIADYLVKNGHEAVVVSNGGRLVPELEGLGARHIMMQVHRKSLKSLGQIRPFRELLETEKPDILHIRSRVPGWIAWMAWRKMNVATRPRLVTTVHGFYSVNGYSEVMTKGERVIAVSESIRKYIAEHYPKTDLRKVTVIHRGIVPEMYPPGFVPDAEWLRKWLSQQPGLENKFVFLLPGRITRLKGHDDFLKMLGRLKESGKSVHGLIAGGVHENKTGYLNELKERVHTAGMTEDVTFLGFRSDVREIMAISDVVCALSQQPESFGRTVLEAMALGKPVLGYDCGGVGELLDAIFPEGKVPPGNAEILFAKAVAILESDGLPLVPEGAFTLERMCADTVGVYEELLSSPRTIKKLLPSSGMA